MTSFQKLLLNKRVVIVGPAPSIINSTQGEYIDSFDIVVRINKAIPIPEYLKKDIGSRTDILYNCLNSKSDNGGEIELEIIKKLKYICCPYPPIYPFKKDIDTFMEQFIKRDKENKINFRHVDTKFYLKTVREMNTRPNSGIAAILDLLQFSLKELYITGFTFFKGGYYKEYRSYSETEVLERMKKIGNHDQKLQIKYMKKIFLKDNRIIMDKELKKIILD